MVGLDRFMGTQIQIARVMKGWSRDALARRLGLATVRIERMEAGRERIPPALLIRMAALMQMPLDAVFARAEAFAEAMDPDGDDSEA